jgi:hypothetical protein
MPFCCACDAFYHWQSGCLDASPEFCSKCWSIGNLRRDCRVCGAPLRASATVCGYVFKCIRPACQHEESGTAYLRRCLGGAPIGGKGASVRHDK